MEGDGKGSDMAEYSEVENQTERSDASGMEASKEGAAVFQAGYDQRLDEELG